MREQILIQGEPIKKHKALLDFLPGGTLSAAAMIYGIMLYKRNVNDCRIYFLEGSCMPEWDHSFLEFLRSSMGPNTSFPVLTMLIWCGLICLLAGIFLFFAFKTRELTVTDNRIYGRAAFGTEVQISFPSVLDAEELPGHGIKLVLSSGSLIFGGIKNNKEVCRVIRENAVLRDDGEKKQVQIGSRGLSGFKLAALCFLPFLLLFLPILLWGEPTLGKAWETYWGWDRMQEQFSFLAFWLGEQMSQRENWPVSLIYIAFPALLAGGISFCACSRQKILITDSRVQGRGSFHAAFDLPLSEINAARGGHGSSVILHHTHGRIRIIGLRNREEVLRILEKNLDQRGETCKPPKSSNGKTLEGRMVSDGKLGVFCFLPLAVFLILLAIGVYRNADFCREVFESVAAIREQHSYSEYLLIWTLAGNLGRWIKAFFWISLLGLYGFFAFRSTVLTLRNGRLSGRSRGGGYLEEDEDSICGLSMGMWGRLALYTDSGKFIFGPMKNRSEFYEYFEEKLKKHP